ncbi:FxsB family cyclophane-forming radical SAM/SPASM peptide maturase [Streptomyces sp. V1I1]|uniref:FxsB family cyclophane-forming radical SAM/SPASM peptide maturase n=1 Tax=Streptomyces sp. V1I1 TaxID=3042272 RepID=UPI00278B9424|nr:FxsB family cyclophane-forming radical SAM/SPASM peptide maturase [Streptomyces sp. V1I1]MDQ0941145.1 uncharacterized protein [Streptomyces sp. V1I1]
MQPFTQFILKMHGHCNLRCDYCYLYEMADQSWRTRPAAMSTAVLEATVYRMSEHIREFSLPSVQVVLHGGEPLLAGYQRISHAAEHITTRLSGSAKVSLGIQTNGLLLDEEYLELFDRFDIKVGISLDGARAAHDRHRKDRRGSGSHARVSEKLSLLTRPETRHLFSGLLATVSLENDPLETYGELLAHNPPAVDFLLPHGNWTNPPPGRHSNSRSTPYADWLLPIFERWYEAPLRETGVRLFEDVIMLLLGSAARSESVGLTPFRSLIVETDGSLEQVDSLKSAFAGAAGLGLNVRDHALQEALAHPATVARQLGAARLCDTCRACSLQRVCGGGHIAHRYRVGHGFLNPSVYCRDLQKLIVHVRSRLHADIFAAGHLRVAGALADDE